VKYMYLVACLATGKVCGIAGGRGNDVVEGGMFVVI